MNNTSLSAQAVATGPMTAAPPSFDGHGWLVVVNLAFFTAVAIIGAMFACEQVRHLWRNRHRDTVKHPVTIWRLMGLLLFTAAALRCGAAAAMLWKWNPQDPGGTGWVLTMQRFVDPIALTFGVAAMAIFVLSARGVVDQLRREPPAKAMWLSVPQLRRPAYIALLSLIAAIGVVSTR